MSSIEIYHKVYTDSNSCEVSCSDKFFITELRENAEERIKNLTTANRKKSFTGNFEADVGEAIRRNLRITHDDTNSIHTFWNDHELD